MIIASLLHWLVASLLDHYEMVVVVVVAIITIQTHLLYIGYT